MLKEIVLVYIAPFSTFNLRRVSVSKQFVAPRYKLSPFCAIHTYIMFCRRTYGLSYLPISKHYKNITWNR